MHPSHTKLLELRDGEGTVETELHVRSCPHCARELDELRAAAEALRDLPSLLPESDLWPRLEVAVIDRRRRRTRLMMGAAAATLLMAATMLVAVRFDNRNDLLVEATAAEAESAVQQLQVASRELERVLQIPSLRSPVLTPQRAAIIVDLEDRIALVDFALAERAEEPQSSRAVALWSDRVELLDALVVARGGVREGADFQYASFKKERSN